MSTTALPRYAMTGESHEPGPTGMWCKHSEIQPLFDEARAALDGLLSVLAAYRKTTGVMDGSALQGWEITARAVLEKMTPPQEEP